MSIERFREAQNASVGGFTDALDELRSGGKQSHWIWYVFPQLEGLGRSPQARRFALNGEAEAIEYLHDAELRGRLLTVTASLVEQLRQENAPPLSALMGSEIDAIKLVSSLTLFGHVARALATREPIPEYDAIAEAADAVLARAEREGYPPCAYTRRRLGK